MEGSIAMPVGREEPTQDHRAVDGGTHLGNPGGRKRPFVRRRKPQKTEGQHPGRGQNEADAQGVSGPVLADGQPSHQRQAHRNPPRHGGPNTSGASAVPGNAIGASGGQQHRGPQRGGRPAKPATENGGSGSGSSEVPSREPSKSRPRAPKEGNSRRAKFGTSLTEPASNNAKVDTQPSEKYKVKNTTVADDLTSTLIHALSAPPYPDCPICFSAIHPAQPIWSCSPSTPVISSHEAGQVQYCWTSFHTKCIKSWAAKSVKEVADAWRARGEEGKVGDWRCPGCQAKREIVPSVYRCFCGSTPEPRLARLSTPHSCGKSCSRTRESGCGHPCPLLCHPGPCPPCQVTTRLKCRCPRGSVLAFKCGINVKGKGNTKRDLSCGNICGRVLGCGKHECTAVCHDGDCGKCAVRETVRCWCGKEEMEMDCGEGKPVECFVEGESPWVGGYDCDNTCERFFDCGVHKCEKSCHPPSPKPDACPRSPSKVTHCPCGKSTIEPSPSVHQSSYTYPARTSCSSPIPTCSSPCLKPQAICSHACMTKCHTGPCPPCPVRIVRPCRCGATTRSLPCHETHEAVTPADGFGEKEILCDRPCTALRACGRHQCRRICCPLASLAAISGKKGKKRAVEQTGIGEEQGGLHECDLVCGKMLSCGNHRCEEKDHRGVCPPCLRSSFEELICFCGRTVLEPPIPCGTMVQCNYPCQRPPSPCGHPRTTHSCHDDAVPCPPCPFLATKQCACGKKVVPNVRCSLETEKVSCGIVCGKLMSCGFHHCESLCHGGDCGTCTAPCGKVRKLCLPNYHPCTQPCHAPSTCPETDPCQSTVTLTCPCGRIRQPVQCARRVSHPTGHQPTAPKCTNECSIAKRNARLAEALGISTESKDKNMNVTYNDELLSFARANAKFLPIVEKAFADFIASDKRTQVLPHMPLERRKFVHDLASVYRMDTQMVDQEPHRSVQLLRRIDTRIPNPLLSTYMITSIPAHNLGKLADLRSLQGGTQSHSWRTPSPAATPPLSKTSSYFNASGSGAAASTASGYRGWTSVAARPPGLGSTSAVLAPQAISTAAGGTAAVLLHNSRAPTPRGASVQKREVEAVTSGLHQDEQPVTEDWEDDV